MPIQCLEIFLGEDVFHPRSSRFAGNLSFVVDTSVTSVAPGQNVIGFVDLPLLQDGEVGFRVPGSDGLTVDLTSEVVSHVAYLQHVINVPFDRWIRVFLNSAKIIIFDGQASRFNFGKLVLDRWRFVSADDVVPYKSRLYVLHHDKRGVTILHANISQIFARP